MKKLFLLLIFVAGLFTATNAQNALKDWDFEKEELVSSLTKYVNVDQPGWFVSYLPENLKVLNDKTPAILDDSIKYDDTKFNKDSVLIPNTSYRGPITRMVEGGNHFVHVDPISAPATSGFDLMMWQEVFDLNPGAYELRFKVRSMITSFQSNVIAPAYPGVHINIKDVTGTFVNLTDVVPSFPASETWRTHRVNFTVKATSASTRVSFWFDRFVAVDIDDVELIELPNVIPTFKNVATKTLQNEGLADFELGNYPSTMDLKPFPGTTNPATNVFTSAGQITGIAAFPSATVVASYGANTVASRVSGVPVDPYVADTVFWSPFIMHGADPIQGAVAYRGEVRGLTLDSINAYRASLSTPCFDAQGSNGVARKVKLIFWARTEGKDMLLRVDNISGSGTSTAARKVQNVLISGTEYKEYVVNDTMPAVLPNQSMNSQNIRPTPRYRLNLRTAHSVVHLDYMRLESWDGVTPGSPNTPDPTAVKNTKADFGKIAVSGGNVIVAANEPVLVNIYDLSGSLVKQQQLNGSRLVNTQNLKGIFIVKAVGTSGQMIQKVIL